MTSDAADATAPDETPPTDLRLVPAALTAWLVTASGILWSVGPALAVLFAIAGLLCAAQRRRLGVAAAGMIGICAVGTGFSAAIALRHHAVEHHPLAQQIGSVVEVTVTPSESPRALGHGRLMFRADLDRVGPQPGGGRVVVFAPALPFVEATAGRPLRFRARVSAPGRRDLTVATLVAAGSPTAGQASAVQRAAARVRQRFAAAAWDTLPADQAAMLPALVLGDTVAMTETATAQFRLAGLTHLTAVSGANVTIVCGTVLFAAALIGPRAAAGSAGITLVAFVVVVQPSASVLRAAVMGAVTLLAVLTARHRQAIPALAGAVLILLVPVPQLAVDVGFALSVSATAALVLLAPVWSRRLVARGWLKPLADAVCIAAAAQLVTAPLIAGISGSLSLLAVLANLLVAPVIAPITVLGSAAAALASCWPAGAQLLIRFTGPELWWLLTVSRATAAAPGAAVPVPDGPAGVVVIALLGMGAVLIWRTRWRTAAIVVATVCVLGWAITDLSGGRDTIVG